MPYHEVHCPCGTTKMIYRAPGKPAPKYCSMACRKRFHRGNYHLIKYRFTPEMDEVIRTVYAERVLMGWKKDWYRGPVKKLAEKFGMPRWRVSSRARELEVMPVQKKEPVWSETEIWMLTQCAHRSPPVIQKYLKRAGYQRSEQGIRLKRKRLHLSRATMNGYTSRSLAGLFGVDDHGIMRWIKKGWLKAERRGTARTPQQGGDEWFIRPEWVRDFIIANVAVIDFRKVDKYWLVEVLSNVKLSMVRQAHHPEQSRRTNNDQVKMEDPIENVETYESDAVVMDLFDEAQNTALGMW